MLAFGCALGAYELPVVYAIGCTFLQGSFCLGHFISCLIECPACKRTLVCRFDMETEPPYNAQSLLYWCVTCMQRSIASIQSSFSHSTVNIHWFGNISGHWSGRVGFYWYKFNCAQAENLGRSGKVVRTSLLVSYRMELMCVITVPLPGDINIFFWF